MNRREFITCSAAQPANTTSQVAKLRYRLASNLARIFFGLIPVRRL